MQSFGWYVRRLASMSPAEIAWRVRSLLRDQADIVRIPLGLLPRLPHEAGSTPECSEPGFSCSPVTPDDWLRIEAENRHTWSKRVTAQADRVLENRLSYFDLDNLHHGEPFNWHRDHSAGIDSPVRLSVLTDYRDFPTYGDCKLVWEPNRHHQFVVLARAYRATGDYRYATKAAELMRSWLDANPFGYGMNWKSGLEHGVRIINWVWTIDLIKQSGAIDAELWEDICRAMHLAMWDAQRRFSRGSSANNHLVGEAAGVFIGARYFSAFPHSAEWANKAQQILENEIANQTYEDGCTREHAFGYQFFVIQFLTLCLLAGDATGNTFTDTYRERLYSMYRFLHELCQDSGAPPNMGDRDDGYVLNLGELPDEPKALLAVGAALFEDSQLAAPEPSETVFWLFGHLPQTDTKAVDKSASVSFPASGYHLLRSDRLAVFFDCAELGYGPIAAHGHADCLSLTLAVDGQPVFVDPGTYDYFSHPEWRNYFRETRAHNTAEVDRRSQSRMLGPFMWGQRAMAQLTEWEDSDLRSIAAGQHDGYTKLDDPVIHTRRIRLDKQTDTMSVTDSFSATAEHTIRLHFHVQPGLIVRRVSASEVVLELTDSVLHVSATDASIRCIRADENTKLGWISGRYHEKQASACLQIEKRTCGNAEFRTDFRLQ